MTHEEFQKAANHWNVKDAQNTAMDRAALLAAAEAYILENNTAALATGAGTFVRCTPIEYAYHDGAFWMFSEGGEKFFALEQNPNVCLAIYDKYEGFGNVKGMQVSGTAEIVEPYSKEYLAAADFKKIPLAALKKLPETMNLIKVTPKRIDFLNSNFKKAGFSSRQKLIF
jgi:nitroimidazol reductase NimA-like FMN-containing flavoprotein (pyridoxamine 5'-phosphate oxidase superfamily)